MTYCYVYEGPLGFCKGAREPSECRDPVLVCRDEGEHKLPRMHALADVRLPDLRPIMSTRAMCGSCVEWGDGDIATQWWLIS
jgi:hypothetical protein